MFYQASILLALVGFALSKPISSCSEIVTYGRENGGSWTVRLVVKSITPDVEFAPIQIQFNDEVRTLETDFGDVSRLDNKNFIITWLNLHVGPQVHPLAINFHVRINSDTTPQVNSVKIGEQTFCANTRTRRAAVALPSQFGLWGNRDKQTQSTTEIYIGEINWTDLTAAVIARDMARIKIILGCTHSSITSFFERGLFNALKHSNFVNPIELMAAIATRNVAKVRKLLKCGPQQPETSTEGKPEVATPEIIDGINWTDLTAAVTDGDFNLVKTLLHCEHSQVQGSQLNVDELKAAIATKDIAKLRSLFECDLAPVPDVSTERATSEQVTTPTVPTPIDPVDELMKAAAAKDVDKMKELLKCGEPIENKQTKSENAENSEVLLTAAANGNLNEVKSLLEAGASLTHMDSDKRTALIRAARNGHVDVVALLLYYGADIEAKDAEGNTALHWATWFNHPAAIEILLCKGANVEAKEGSGKTPLIYAAKQNHADLINMLLLHGAEIEAADNEKETALHGAVWNNNTAAVETLLEKGANIEAREEAGSTPLIFAARQNCVPILKMLLAKGADINNADDGGDTALHWAVWKNVPEVVEELLAKGANIEAKQKSGRTPLIDAGKQGYTAVINLLLDKGAQIDAADNDGETALSWAEYKGHTEAAEALKARGAKPRE